MVFEELSKINLDNPVKLMLNENDPESNRYLPMLIL